MSFASLKSFITRITRQKESLLMFHHLAKNAGSSLRQILQSNYTPEQLLEFYDEPTIRPKFRNPVEWYRHFYISLPEKRKRSLKCLSGHSIHYLLPTLGELDERPCRVFCILRHPVDRMLSLYHFIQRFPPESGQGGIIAKIIQEKGWGMEDIYLNLGEGNESTSKIHFLFREFFNGQARTILLPHMPQVSTADFPFTDDILKIPQSYRDKLKQVINKYYIMGAQEEYNRSVQYFAKKFGWSELIYEKTNITESRPALDTVSPELVRLVERYNKLDMELYRAAVANVCKFSPEGVKSA